MEQFHYFLYGKECTLQTDQKATCIDLQETYGRNLSKDSKIGSEKLAISVLSLCRYRKGVEIPLADALSRVTPLPMKGDGIQLPIIAVNLVTANILYSSNELDIIHEETRKDPTFKLLMHYISTGWPCECRRLPQKLHLYWNFWEDLSVKDRLATKSSKLLIPCTLRQKVLGQIHDGHQDIEKCMLKARESVFLARNQR